jgi:hypothetical protein
MKKMAKVFFGPILYSDPKDIEKEQVERQVEDVDVDENGCNRSPELTL